LTEQVAVLGVLWDGRGRDVGHAREDRALVGGFQFAVCSRVIKGVLKTPLETGIAVLRRL
jgi:hypothetical protein